MNRSCCTWFLLFIAASINPIVSQPHNNHWYFGYNAGLTFDTDPPTPLLGAVRTVEGTACISDRNGGLLFYTDGTTIYDRRHQPMPNGTGLKGGESSSQSAAIVPLPASCSRYYVFTTEDQFSNGGLAYSVVDMALNGGYGDVVNTEKNITLVDLTGEQVTAILHANGIDSWIVTHKQETNTFYTFLLTAAGLSGPVLSSAGTVHGEQGPENWMIGHLRPSHDGSKLALSVTFEHVCELFDFNNATGVVSNPIALHPFFNDDRVYGMEFSPNDSLLYLGAASYENESNYIFQVDYKQPVITHDTVATLVEDFGTEFYGTMQLGNNGKIYVARRSAGFICAIHFPDLRGDACGFQDTSVLLLPETSSTFGLQNVAPYSFCPLFNLGPDRISCAGDDVLLELTLPSTVVCPISYSWSTGLSEPVQTITSSGTYWIEVTSACSTYRDSINVHFVDAISTAFSAAICEGDVLEGYSLSGTYVDTLVAAAGCDSIRTLILDVIPTATSLVEKLICPNGSYLGYTETGVYRDTFESFFGCDSIRVLKLIVIECDAILSYSMDACESFMSDGSHMDYAEFQPDYPSTPACADVSGDFIYRVSPQKHSCTPGWASTPGMCVGTLNSCTYTPGAPESVILEFTIDPHPDSAIQLNQFSFYEKGPPEYEWISGPTGQNNRPSKFGVRILKNGVEVFRRDNQNTHLGWAQVSFSLLDSTAFRVDSTAHFRIELLAYCLVGNGAVESVWDLDEFRVHGGCVMSLSEPLVGGHVFDRTGRALPNVRIDLSAQENFDPARSVYTDSEGMYSFNALQTGKSYYLRAYNNDAPLQFISALDLLRLQKHLLGIDPFSELDVYVAADVNHSHNLNVLDILSIQKLLLGLQSQFPNNTSWRFGALPLTLQSTDTRDFNEVHFIESLHGDVMNIDFLGVKIGNVHDH